MAIVKSYEEKLVFLAPSKSNREKLKSQNFCFVPGEAMQIPGYLKTSWGEFENSWNNLAPDNYMKTGDTFRKRRFARFQYKISNDQLEISSNNQFLQSSDINKYAGDVIRELPQIEDKTASSPFLHHLIKSSLFHFIETYGLNVDCWEITLHQFRIEAQNNCKGLPTPEGVHQDGHSFISMHLINRHNVSGGVSKIYDDNKYEIESITLTNPMDTLLVNDKKLFHSVSPVIQINDTEVGYRDVLVIDYNISGVKQ